MIVRNKLKTGKIILVLLWTKIDMNLRATFLLFPEPALPSPDSPDVNDLEVADNEPIRPYERRALNFLVNEYLLNNSYKLTSVTFAEENENQVCESHTRTCVCV